MKKNLINSALAAKTKNLFLALSISAIVIALVACENRSKDTMPPVIEAATFLPTDCDIYYLGDTIKVHFVCSDDTELGNYNIEIHNNFDHHTHGTSGVDCDGEEEEEHHHDEETEHEHHHDEETEHEHEHDKVEGAWVFNQDYALLRGLLSDTVDVEIPVPADVQEGDYHFMLRLTDRAGWQTIKAVAIHLQL